MSAVFDIAFGGLFYASIIFLIAAGLQVVFGTQKILNLACGSFYALGAYAGISFIDWFVGPGSSAPYFMLVLIAAGLSLFFLGPVIERGVLKFIYPREEVFQLLATFALVLIFEDIIKIFWGIYPRIAKGTAIVYQSIHIGEIVIPLYHLFVIVCSFSIALIIGFVIKNTKFGKMLRAVADDREMAAALGINVTHVYLLSFTLGTVLGTLGGSLIIPVTAAMLGMGIEAIVLAFAVVVIGGLGSMMGAFIGAIIVGMLKAVALATFPELETFVIYLLVIIILLIRPWGLFGRPEIEAR
ncbi:MAG: branched-chain amino acid ABC transporter permease [Candidatus Methanomethylicota archaeon]|uniref:Branched-chain amino acid ABC transporter permease n=1 Tax=Thermoproteota archaeon TaxID=2056631 RepID=A0A497ERR5_9CREN|nr:MAG: branched-chain amino acid ABC transporter permease [Candidatus Verstraetearchaeota archaeon]